MSQRNLERLFKPASIALIGASKRPGSVGAVVARNLFGGGFEGPVLPVHPKHGAIEGVLAYPSVAALPLTPDLAVIATPPDTVAGLIGDLGARGTKAVVVITAGFERGAGHRALLEAAKPHTLRIVGPNCLGVMVPGAGVNAGFSHVAPLPGDLALVSQSGAIVTALLDWARPRGLGFSHVVSLGDMCDVDVGDMLDYLALDGGTRAILLYIEALTETRKFMSAARAAARIKPVIVVKGGRHAAGAKAATSHTGALAGSDAVYDAALARAGMLRVISIEELFDAAETLAYQRAVPGDRLAVITNGGGLGVLAADMVIDQGGRLAELAPETLARLDAALPAGWSHGNPIDIVGDAPGERYAAAVSAALDDPGVDAVLAMHCPVAVASPLEAAQAVAQAAAGRKRTVFTAWVGDTAVREARALFARAKMPSYDTPEDAVRAFMHLVKYREHQEMLTEIPPSVPGHFTADGAAVRKLIDAALAEDRPWLSEPESKAALAAYGIPVVPALAVATPEEAARAASDFGAPAALKILSPDITHKSDVGGVALNLEPGAVRQAAEAMRARVAAAAPDARLDGFIVEPMQRRGDAQELILGVIDDPQFGPAVLFGQGGTAVEVVQDKALALPPLNLHLARALMAQTRVYRLLQGYRDRPPAALDAIALALVNLAQLATDFAEIAEVDINPLLADADGVIALDARIRVVPVSPALRARPTARLAIRPYPKELERTIRLRDGQAVLVRPIRPEDAPVMQAAFRKMDPEHVRLRFFTQMAEMSDAMAKRLTQIDYEREMALVAMNPEPTGAPDGWGVARIFTDPDGTSAEFAVTVRSDFQGRGLGAELLSRIIDYTRSRGAAEIWGDVLATNRTMLALARDLGFRVEQHPEEAGIYRVTKRLDQ